jgi:hypothetical protein
MKIIEITMMESNINPGTNIFYATFKRMYPGISGCPMGRGKDAASALKDLEYRVQIESHCGLGEFEVIDNTKPCPKCGAFTKLEPVDAEDFYTNGEPARRICRYCVRG